MMTLQEAENQINELRERIILLETLQKNTSVDEGDVKAGLAEALRTIADELDTDEDEELRPGRRVDPNEDLD